MAIADVSGDVKEAKSPVMQRSARLYIGLKTSVREKKKKLSLLEYVPELEAGTGEWSRSCLESMTVGLSCQTTQSRWHGLQTKIIKCT